MLQTFTTIIEKSREREIVPFLRSLSDEQKKILAPGIKKLYKEYTDFKETTNLLGNKSWGSKANDAQRHMLLISCFVCLSRQDYERVTGSPGWILDEKHLWAVIEWYRPDWFDDFVNKLAQQDSFYYTFNYKAAMTLADKGLLNPGKEVIVKLLPNLIFENVRNTSFYRPERVLEHPVTLREHIWYLFEMESHIHYCNRWLNFGDGESKKVKGWIELFKQYTTEGKIDRYRVLQQSLLASNKNFNNQLSGWFIELFGDMEPGEAEILNLQKELFSVLSSPQSKPVNVVLQHLKKVATDKQFDAISFLDNVPALLSTDKKNIILSTLSILEKLAKHNKALQLPVCKAVIPVFIHANDDLQLRAAKLIAVYRDSCDDEFTEALQPYEASLMMSAKNLLGSFFVTVKQPVAQKTPADGLPVEDGETLTMILEPENIDDVIFLASQAFDNNQSWHIDMLPHALIKWQHELRGENIARLEPALQRALQMTKSEFRSHQGSIDHMLAIFFIDFCILLTRRFPNETGDLRALFKRFDQSENGIERQWMAISSDSYYMTTWDNHYHDPCYLIHKNLLLAVLQKIREQDLLPLLCTPTHEPAYILPETLVQRMLLYQKANKTPFNIDCQVAVSRCLLIDTGDAIRSAEELLDGEYKKLLLFLFGKHQGPQGPFINPAAWMCSALAKHEKKMYEEFTAFSYYKNPFTCYTGSFPWTTIEEEYDMSEYSFQEKKTITKKATRKLLRVTIDRSPVKQKGKLKNILSGILHKQTEDPACIYDSLTVKAQWLSIENDIRRILLLTPNNPGPMLAEITQHCMDSPVFLSETDKKTAIACLQTLYETWDDPGEMAYLFLGASMVASDKTVRNIAAEIWMKSVSNRKMNNEKLGNIIGRIESIEFAPLKRLTDLISQSMFRISDLHNEALVVLIGHILPELPDTPIMNLKKLLELYGELLSNNNFYTANDKLQDKLITWSNNTGLQKIIKTLNKKEV